LTAARPITPTSPRCLSAWQLNPAEPPLIDAEQLFRQPGPPHPDKTSFIDFRPQRHGGTPPDCKAQSFDFLGFTHSWGKSRKGKNVVRQMTAKRRFARSLAAIKDWCRTNRHRLAREQRAWLSAVLVGHYAYYGITGNIWRLQQYRYQVMRIWHKWLERRTRGRRLLWANFNAFLARHPLPAARIIHRYTRWNESLA
jgi:RNA-directed DNA polymerase